MLASLLAVVFTMGPVHWELPRHWESLPPPEQIQIDYAFLPLPKYRDGQNVTVTHHALKAGATLQEEARRIAESEEEDGRTIVRVSPFPTCAGKLPGFEIDAKFGMVASQLFHVAVENNQVYILTYTYGPNASVDSGVRAAIQSLCPNA